MSRNQYSAQGRIQGVLMRAGERVKSFIRKTQVAVVVVFFFLHSSLNELRNISEW